MILDRIEHEGSKDCVDASTVKVRKVGKDRKIFGQFTYKQPLNNSVLIKLTVSKKTGSGYNTMPYKIEKPICNFFSDDSYFYPELTKCSTFPDSMPCPIPAVRIFYESTL